ncbi:MAG TPA: TMEM165/GDT1 family protein [Bdellovibrionota bacterium]|nr:TMEM165/GDT1 family protein [Bdellovibrionota bacterium]
MGRVDVPTHEFRPVVGAGGLAVYLGDRMAEKIKMKWVRWVAAALFFGFALWSAVQAFQS